jgi:hypothetical protein
MAILQTSGSDLFDASAAKAIIVSSPFPELNGLPNDEFQNTFKKFVFLFQPGK